MSLSIPTWRSLVWRLCRPVEGGGFGKSMAEVQGLTLYQVFLLLAPESEISGNGDPDAIRDWLKSRKQHWTPKSKRTKQA